MACCVMIQENRRYDLFMPFKLSPVVLSDKVGNSVKNSHPSIELCLNNRSFYNFDRLFRCYLQYFCAERNSQSR